MRAALLTTAAVLVALLAAGCGDDGGQTAAQPAVLALDFQPNAAHAGVYAAVADDLDAKHGLDLRVRVPGASTDSLKLLAAGRSDLSIVDIHDLGLARERGADVVGVGALVQRPLAAVIAKPEIRRPRDLEGRRVGVTGLPSDDAVLRAIVEHDGGDYGRVKRVTIGFSAVPSLVAGKVDAVVTFWNAEGVALKARGVPTREFRVDEYGAPRYPELVVATTSKTLRDRRELVDDVVATLADGTRAALADRPAAVREIAHAAAADEDLTARQLDAIAPALRPPLRLDPAAVKGWAAFDAQFGILRSEPDVAAAFPTLGG
jgi:putative hydroxymethylpyrimidine transport system substrate-binding protein